MIHLRINKRLYWPCSIVIIVLDGFDLSHNLKPLSHADATKRHLDTPVICLCILMVLLKTNAKGCEPSRFFGDTFLQKACFRKYLKENG